MNNLKNINENISKYNIFMFVLMAILVVSIVGVGIGLVIAEGSEQDLEQELAQLVDELTNSGYNWLVDYSGELPAVEPAEIEVYTQDNDTLIATFTDVGDEDWVR